MESTTVHETLINRLLSANLQGYPLLSFIDVSMTRNHTAKLLYPGHIANTPEERMLDNSIFAMRRDAEFYRDQMLTVLRVSRENWIYREMARSTHPSILRMMDAFPTTIWFSILSEYPHVAEDGARVAFTRDVNAGINDRQTVTTAGKYIKRHWPDVADNLIRDVVSLFTPDSFEFKTTTRDMVEAVQAGPKTCMRWTEREHSLDSDPSEHPYASYSPELGWSLAVRYSDGRIDGRCLVHTDLTGVAGRVFVRSFARNKEEPEGGYSGSDTALEAWLKDNGVQKHSAWASRCRIDTGGDTRFPYIDGDVQTIDGSGYITNSDTRYKCDNVDGSAEDSMDFISCSDCDDYIREDDTHTVGYRGRYVCGCCRDSYSYAYGRGGEQYYIRDNETVCVDDEVYDERYIHDNNIVQLENGEYENEENCTRVSGSWYKTDDDDLVYVESQAHYYMADDSDVITRADNETDIKQACWYCEESEEWYSDNEIENRVMIYGLSYHRDNMDDDMIAQYQVELNRSNTAQTELNLEGTA